MKSFRLCKEDYEEIKQRLGMRQVAEHYGFRADRNGLCICPFHNDKRPSMKLYPHDKGYYCFSCGSGGDVISFVSRLHGVNNEQAARQLIADFSLPIQTEGLTYREQREREKKLREQREFDSFIAGAKKILGKYRILLCEATRSLVNTHFFEAFQELSIVEYRLECLDKCPREVWADRKAVREKLGKIRKRIASWDA